MFALGAAKQRVVSHPAAWLGYAWMTRPLWSVALHPETGSKGIPELPLVFHREDLSFLSPARGERSSILRSTGTLISRNILRGRSSDCFFMNWLRHSTVSVGRSFPETPAISSKVALTKFSHPGNGSPFFCSFSSTCARREAGVSESPSGR